MPFLFWLNLNQIGPKEDTTQIIGYVTLMYDINWTFDSKTLFKATAYSLTTCTVYVKHYLQCAYLLFEKTHRLDYTLYNTSSKF